MNLKELIEALTILRDAYGGNMPVEVEGFLVEGAGLNEEGCVEIVCEE